MYRIVCLLAVLGLCAPGFAQNQLQNPSFEDDVAPADNWPDYWTYPDTAEYMTGPEHGASARTGTDYMRAASDGGQVTGTVEQSVGLPDGVGYYALTLTFWGWVHDEDAQEDSVTGEIIVDGGSVASVVMVSPEDEWTQQQVAWEGSVAIGITVKFTLQAQGTTPTVWDVVALDDAELIADKCDQHTVSGIDPGSHDNLSDTSVTIDGTKLDLVDSVKLVGDGVIDIPGYNLNPAGDGLSMTVELATDFKDAGVYDLVVGQTGCPDAVLEDVFTVTVGNLLGNPDFSNPPLTECSEGTYCYCGLLKEYPSFVDPWSSIGRLERNNDICGAGTGICADTYDNTYATLMQEGMLYQTVSVSPNQWYTFYGVWYYFCLESTPYTVRARVSAGGSPSGPNLGTPQEFTIDSTDCNNSAWATFRVTFPTLSNDEVTVVIETSGDCCYNAVHIDRAAVVQGKLDQVVLEEPTLEDPNPDPDTGPTGETVTGVEITGSGFTTGTPTVKLKRGAVEVEAENVVVHSDSWLTCDLPLFGVDPGSYSVVVDTGIPCWGTLWDAFDVTFSGPFSNGSFEEPVAPGSCDPYQGHPDDWLWGSFVWSGGDIFNINGYFHEGTLPWRPSCSLSNQYATIATDEGGSTSNEAFVWQTFEVSAGLEYTFAGFFAGSGHLVTKIQMQNGAFRRVPEEPRLLGETVINDAPGDYYDWKFAWVTGTPTTDALTVAWRSRTQETGISPSAAHADELEVETCTTDPFWVTGIEPNTGLNNDTVSVTDLAGQGFSGTPIVVLRRGQMTIQATNVVVVSGTKITCDFDVTGAASGRYDVVVYQAGCIGLLPEGFLVIAESLINGDFELPTVPLDPCEGRIPRIPIGWNAITVGDNWMVRNSQAPEPSECPSPAGGHYGSLSGNNTEMSGYQVLSVTPGHEYQFSGYFDGGPAQTCCVIRLWDGELGETFNAKKEVFPDRAHGRWIFDSVAGEAPVGGVMTIEWYAETRELLGGGAHADGVTFSDCHTPPDATSIIPASGSPDLTYAIEITGTGFDPTPGAVEVILQGLDLVYGSNVSVSGPDTLITFDLDLAGVTLGDYDVIVVQGGCSDVMEDEFTVECIVPESTVTSIEEGDEAGSTAESSFAMTLNGTNLDQLTDVKLVRVHGSAEIIATSLSEVGTGATQRDATFDLTTAEMGRYDVVFTHPCPVDSLEQAFLVYRAEPSNLSFETGTATDPPGLPCPAPGSDYDKSRPLHWDEPYGQEQLSRDSGAFPPPCPLPDGDHYGTISIDRGPNTLSFFQTFAAVPGEVLVVVASFAGATSGGSHTGTFKLLDGDENSATVLDSTSITNATTLTWAREYVSGWPAESKVTLVIEMVVSGTETDLHAIHVDGIEFPCNDPFADVDDDNDVDMGDFGVFQRCYTGEETGIPDEPEYCPCFEVSGPGGDPDDHIEAADLTALEACWSGPGIPHDPCCDGGEGCPE